MDIEHYIIDNQYILSIRYLSFPMSMVDALYVFNGLIAVVKLSFRQFK